MTTLILLAVAKAGPTFSVKLEKTVPNLHPIAFAPAPVGSQVAISMEDSTVRILDAKTRNTTRNLATHPQPAYAVIWSSDGAWIATGDESARIWIEDARNGSKVREYRTHTRGIQKLSFDSARKLLASTGKDDQIKIYDTSEPTAKEKFSILGKGSNVYGAEFSPTSSIISTGILSDAGREYDGTIGNVVGFVSYGGSQGTYDMSYNPTGTRVVTAGRDGTAVIFDAKTNKKIASLKGHQDWVIDAAFSPNGQFIATSSTDRTVKIWNAFSFAKVAELTDQSSVGSPLAWTADGNYLLTVDISGGLQVNRVSPAQPTIKSAVKLPVQSGKAAKSGKSKRGRQGG